LICTNNINLSKFTGEREYIILIMKVIRFLLCLFFCLVFNIFTGDAQDNNIYKKVFPGKDWEERTPEDSGVDPVALHNALARFNINSGGAGTDEMVIIRHGYLIWKGKSAGIKHEIFSCTKTFTASVMGILASRGKLKIEDPVVDYYPEFVQGNEGQDAYKSVRFKDLATMTSGYQSISGNCWELHLKGLHRESYACTQLYTIPGKPEYPPRTMFNYDDQNVHMLGYILTKIAGKSLEEVFREGIASHIGINDWAWSDYGLRDGMFFNNPAGTPGNTEAAGINEAQCGIYITPLQFARFGLLYLNYGNWNGNQLLDSAFTETAISNQVDPFLPCKGPNLTGRYGLYWWTNGIQSNGERPWPSAPPATATPHGGGRDFCFVIPEWDMVVVRMSPRQEDPIPEPTDRIWADFFERLKPGIHITQKGD
jgi:CubicO group peptidase (beta-lactamase class C family)